MQLENTQIALDAFAKYVVQQSRTRLTKGRKPYGSFNDTKKLYESLKSEAKVSKNSFMLNFLMEDYGVFLDKGVRGKTSSSKAPNSPFKFGSGSGKKGGLTKGINKWVRRKRLQFYNRKNGRFLSYDSTAFLISRSIYNKGTKPSLFFTKPFERAFDNLPKQLINSFSLDVMNLMKTTINNNKK